MSAISPSGNFQGIVMGRRRALVDLPKDRGSMMDHSVAPTERRAARERNVSGKGQLRPWREADRHTRIFRCRESASARAKIVGCKPVPNFCGARVYMVKAEVTHFGTPLGAPHPIAG